MFARIAKLILFPAVFGYWIVGFYPFNWMSLFTSYDNNVAQTEVGGVAFAKQGIAFTKMTPVWVNAAIMGNSLEVEFEAQSYDQYQTGPARIFTLSADNLNRNFTLGQSGNNLIIRLRTPETSKNGVPEFHIPGVFSDNTFQKIRVLISPQNLIVHVNDKQEMMTQLPSEALSDWDSRYRLALGNEFTFLRPWKGELQSLVVRVGESDFNYSQIPLEMPEKYKLSIQPVIDEFNAFFDTNIQHSLRDWIINLVGFVPLGLLLALIWRQSLPLLIAVVFSMLLSLSIEFGQLFLESRISSVIDLILNTVGGLVGASTGNLIRKNLNI